MKNLILHIEQIKDKDFFHEIEEKPEAFPVLAKMVQNRECKFFEPIKVGIRAFGAGDLIEVEGTLQTGVQLSCSRCLIKFKSPIKSDFALTYTKEAPGLEEDATDAEVELRIQEIGLMVFRGEAIDLRKGIQEQIVMAFPLQPLCHENCKGLCPNCGTDLNQQNCGCQREPVSNKFQVLKDLKLDKK